MGGNEEARWQRRVKTSQPLLADSAPRTQAHLPAAQSPGITSANPARLRPVPFNSAQRPLGSACPGVLRPHAWLGAGAETPRLRPKMSSWTFPLARVSVKKQTEQSQGSHRELQGGLEGSSGCFCTQASWLCIPTLPPPSGALGESQKLPVSAGWGCPSGLPQAGRLE